MNILKEIKGRVGREYYQLENIESIDSLVIYDYKDMEILILIKIKLLLYFIEQKINSLNNEDFDGDLRKKYIEVLIQLKRLENEEFKEVFSYISYEGFTIDNLKMRKIDENIKRLEIISNDNNLEVNLDELKNNKIKLELLKLEKNRLKVPTELEKKEIDKKIDSIIKKLNTLIENTNKLNKDYKRVQNKNSIYTIILS